MAKRDKSDIPVGKVRGTHAEAVADMKEQAATLVNLGQQKTHGVYVDRHGQGWSVFLHKRDPFDMS